MKEKYMALRFISNLYKAFALFVFLGTLAVAALVGLSFQSSFRAIQGGYASLASYNIAIEIFALVVIVGGGVVSSVSLWAFANLIDLLIDVEGNTRQAAESTQTISL